MNDAPHYTADTLVKIARQNMKDIEARLKELDEERDHLTTEHASLYAMCIAHEGEDPNA